MINTIFSSRLLGIALILITYVYLIFMPGLDVNVYLIFSNFIVVLFGTLFCFTDKNKPFSLFKIVMLFYVIFFGLAPLLEYKLDVQYWGGSAIADSDYLIANIAIIFSMFFYIGCYFVFYKKSGVNLSLLGRLFALPVATHKQSNPPFLLLMLGLLSCLAVFLYSDFNLNSLFFRGGDFEKNIVIDNKSLALIVANFLRPLAFNVLAVYLLIRQKIDKYAILLVVLAIVGAAPTALPRFQTATLYLSVIFIYVWRAKSKGFHLNNLILIGFVFAFPFLEVFRRFRSWDEAEYRFNLDFLSSGHFDAYQQLTRVIIYDYVSYGYQLLGALLFFVPRAIWPDKPWGSGQFLAESLRFFFSNISMPLLGEGYINFGWFGLFSFVAILAFVTATLDKSFWLIPKDSSGSLLPLAYMQMVGLVFFVMRGDLLNGIAYSSGILASLIVIAYLLRITSSKPKFASIR